MHRHCGDFDSGAQGAGRSSWGSGFDTGAGAWFWGGRGRHRGGPFRRGRVFGQGDLKYVVLQLLAEKPRHGYEIIKELEERFGGAYAPSAGTVYPTLALLEDMGFASVSLEEGGKKVFSITPEGTKYLEENRGAVEDIFERIADFGSSILGDAMMDVNKAFGRVARATYTTAPWHSSDKGIAKAIKDALEAALKIEPDDREAGPADRGDPAPRLPSGVPFTQAGAVTIIERAAETRRIARATGTGRRPSPSRPTALLQASADR